MISLGKTSTPVRISLLEERLQAYDELSKQMLSKLEQAVEKISESNQNISQILIRHEERIDRSTEANDAIIEMLNRNEGEFHMEMEKQDKKFEDEISKRDKRIEDLFTSLEDLKKNRWVLVGIVLASSFFLGQLKVFDRVFPSSPPPALYHAWPSPSLQS